MDERAKPYVAVVGAGGHARVILDVLRLRNETSVWGCVDDNPALMGREVNGVKVKGSIELLRGLHAQVQGVVIAIGNNAARRRLAEQLKSWGYPLFTAIHPSAIVAGSAQIGAGSVIMAGAIIQPGAMLGENVIVNTAATVDHDCRLDEGAHIAPGVHLAGTVHIGSDAFLGVGAVVIPNLVVGEGCIVGAGSVVIRSLPPRTIAFGVPATPQKPGGSCDKDGQAAA